MKGDEKFACKLRREFRFSREPVMLERSEASQHQENFKTEVQQYKRKRAIGDSNTTLADAMERHMTLVAQYKQGCSIGNCFSIAAALTYIAQGIIDSHIVPSQQRKAYVLMFFCLR